MPSYSSARHLPPLYLPDSVLDSEVREGRRRRTGGWRCVCVWGGCPIGILQHLWCSLLFREPSVHQQDKKDAPEPWRHSTGKRCFLSLPQIHTPIQRSCAVFFKYPLSVCLSAFSVHPRQVDARQLAEVERRFCLSV